MTRHCHAIATAIRAAATAQKGTVFLREFASHQLAPYKVRRMPSVNSSRHVRGGGNSDSFDLIPDDHL
jgi:hypothetical protein